LILIDANLLIYAYHSGSRDHEKARVWLEGVMSRPEPVGLAWLTILAFVRITTAPRLLARPFSLEEVISVVDEWLALPQVCLLDPGPRHWEILRGVLASAQATGPLAMDAELAVLALEHGATLCTTDRDFSRFEGLKVLNPIA
jgi:toxin-antitoxin system PIN domain toxin